MNNEQPAIDIDPAAGHQQALAIRQPDQGGAVGPALEPSQIQTRAPMTAAQGKVDAVAALTMAAYEKAATLSLTKEEADALRKDFPDEAFKPGAAGKEHLIYIEHAFLRERFTEVFGMGQWALIPRNRWAEPFTIPARPGKPEVQGSRVYVEAMLVVRGCFVGEAIGEMEYYPHNHAQNYGDAVEGAKTAAFRRCAKEFGVGLQAWKKDFGDGWWQRKRAGTQHNAPPVQQYAPRAQQNAPIEAAAPPPSQGTLRTPGPASATTAATKAAHAAPSATGRARMITLLQAGPGSPHRDLVTDFFEKAEILMPGEQIEEIPLRWVPATADQMNVLSSKITEFGAGGQAAKPYPPNEEPTPPKQATAARSPKAATAAGSGQDSAPSTSPAASSSARPAGVEVPRDTAPAASDPNAEWFMDVIAPIPRKGQKRDEYLRNPDTIGSLYQLRHEQTEEGAAARQRLWGFINHFEPKPWTGRDGTPKPPSAADVKFREALDAFSEWHAKTHPEEKL